MINTMNRIAQLTITLSALFCAMSCSEKIGTELPDTSDYITVTSEVDMQTKAGYEGTSVLPGSFYMTIKQGSANGQSYTLNRDGSTNSYNFSGNSRPTWTTSDVSQVSVRAITNPNLKVNNANYGYDTSTDVMKVCTDQTTAERVEASDLLGAKTGNGITISGNNINVAFNHLMSKLQVSYTSELEIDHIELANVAVEGTYNFTDMKHEYPVTSTGTIKMFNNTNSAEAIFFPFDPKESNVTPELRIYIKGKSTPLTRQIILKDGSRFLPGKLYMVNISVSGNSEVKIENWGANASVQIPGERVLWIGTSIPSGHPGLYTSYPELVDDAMNCTVVNNAIPSSFVAGSPGTADWLNPAHYLWYVDENGEFEQSIFDVGAKRCLSLSHKDYEDVYLEKLREISSYKELIEGSLEGNPDSKGEPDEDWVAEVLGHFQKYSYESLIIPYINGEKDNCTTVIIDHGFNDISNIVFEAGGHATASEQSAWGTVWGYDYYMNVIRTYRGQSGYEKYVSDYVNNHDIVAGLGTDPTRGSYICAMSKVIRAIWEENPNIRIIIGNYFTFNCPYVFNHILSGYEEYFTNLVCFNNEAVAAIWGLDIVNVYKYLWISEEEYWAGLEVRYDDDGNSYNSVVYDPTKFCPDGVHPWANPESIQAIADVYIKALDGVIGSRVN